MIKSIRHQTKKISTNWFQIGKYIIVFVIGILLCRGLTKRNYEYLTNTKYVASTNKNLKVVSENNFESILVFPFFPSYRLSRFSLDLSQN